MPRYTPPILNGHNVVYKSKRYWIFEIDKDHPYERFENHYELIVYDKLEAYPAACCHKDLTGDLNLNTFKENLSVSGYDHKSLIANIDAKLKWFERHMR